MKKHVTPKETDMPEHIAAFKAELDALPKKTRKAVDELAAKHKVSKEEAEKWLR